MSFTNQELRFDNISVAGKLLPNQSLIFWSYIAIIQMDEDYHELLTN